MPAVTGVVKALQLGAELFGRLDPGFAAVEFDDVAELAVERAAARVLNAGVQVIPGIHEIVAGRRDDAQVGLFAVGPEGSAFLAARERRDEGGDRDLALIEHPPFGLGVQLGTMRRVGTSNPGRFSVGVRAGDDPAHLRFLRQHAAGQNEIRPIDQGFVEVVRVHVHVLEIPLLRKQRGHRQQAQLHRRVLAARDAAGFLRVVETVLPKAGNDEEGAKRPVGHNPAHKGHIPAGVLSVKGSPPARKNDGTIEKVPRIPRNGTRSREEIPRAAGASRAARRPRPSARFPKESTGKPAGSKTE